MERYHIYKLGLAILFYAVYYARQTVVNGLKIDDVTSTTSTTDYRERRDSGDDNSFFYQGADGTPGVDFPTLSYVPRTKFSCRDMEAGYYADLETDCQVFHICDEGRKLSFLCPNGTTFQQSELICDWWFKVNCSNSPLLYEESAEILHRENAKRKDSRRLSYHGTKQGVFSSKEDYDHGKDTFGGTPAHLVTPSYRSSLKTIDNRIFATTEGPTRRNYNSRGDRTLDSIGNGVRERDYDKANQFSTRHSQNTFDINLQGKLAERGQTAFSTGTQQKTSTVGEFLFSRNSYSTPKSYSGTNGKSEGAGHVVFNTNEQQVAFDGSSQQTTSGHDKNRFGAIFQDKTINFGRPKTDTQVTSGTGTHQKPGGLVGKISFDRTSQRTTNGRDQNTFNTNLQNSFGTHSQEKSEIGKQATFGTQRQIDHSFPFDTSSKKTTSGQNPNIFGTISQERAARFGQSSSGAILQGKPKLDKSPTFGTSTEPQIDKHADHIPFDISSSHTGEHGQNTFGARLQGSISKPAYSSFGVNLQGKAEQTGEVTFGASAQRKAGENASQIPLDKILQRTSGRDENIFGKGQVTFGTSHQQTVGGDGSQIPLDRRSQKISGRDQNIFGKEQVTFGTRYQQTAGGSASEIPLDRSSQRTSGRDQNISGREQVTFGTSYQQTAGESGSQIPLDRSSQKTSGHDQNVFGREQATLGTSYQQTAGGSVGQIPLDKGSQKTSERDQNVFGREQVTFGTNYQQTAGGSASQIPLDRSSQKTTGRGQNIFDREPATFGTNYQQTAGGSTGQIPLDRSSQKIGEPDQNRFGTNLQDSVTGKKQNGFDITLHRKPVAHEVEYGTQQTTDRTQKYDINLNGQPDNSQLDVLGTGLGTTSSYRDSGLDKIKFSISSQGKPNEFDASKQQSGGAYQQNIFGDNSRNHLTERGQTTGSRYSQVTFGGTGQNRFDLNSQGEAGKFEQTTSRFGLKSSESPQSTFSFTSQQEQDDDGGKIPVLIVSGETQEPQETASFVKNGRNNLLDTNRQRTTNPYPNHRETYADIKDPAHYYQKPQSKLPEKPFYGSSISPQVLSTVPVSAYDSSSRTTTEVSPQKENTSSSFGFWTDISTIKQSAVDANTYNVASTTSTSFRDTEQFSTGKSPVTTNRFSSAINIPRPTESSVDLNLDTQHVEVSTDRGKNGFGHTTIQPTTKSATLGSNKVDVTTYDRGYTNGVDLSLNSISSTLLPDISDDIEGISTIYPSSQKTKYYDEKSSTPKVGINNFGFGNIRSTEKPYSNSPVIKLNIIPSTLSLDYESSTRSGKEFNVDSPKTQVVTLDGSRTKDFSIGPVKVTGNLRNGSRVSVISFGSGEQELNGKSNIIPSTLSLDYESSTRSGKEFNVDSPKTQVVTLDGSRTKDFSIGPVKLTGNLRNGSRVSVIRFGSGEQGLNGKPTIKQFSSSGDTVPPGFIKVRTNGIAPNGNSFRVITGVNINPSVTFNKLGSSTAGTGSSSRTSSTVANGYQRNFVSIPSTKETTPSDLNFNNRHYTLPTTDRDNLGVTLAGGRTGFDINTSTRTTPIETETVEFTINDEVFTTPASATTETINININNENRSAPASVFSVTRQGASGITATTATPSSDETTSSILYTSPPNILQPKPFSAITETLFDSSKIEVTEKTSFEGSGTPQVPPYTISSASPFITTPKPTGDSKLKTLTPTLPTPYTTESASLYSYKPSDENINNMINTLMEVVRQRLAGNDIGFGTPRPGLVVPPSAGPQTLHTLAIYFANALDNLTSSSPREQTEELDDESGTNSPIIHIDNEELIKSLLTQMTLNNYEDLFKEKYATTTELPLSLRTGADDDENDLIREDTKHPTEGPGVRQLARVFTEALSAYLEDPVTFKKVLHDVRPTEPPQLNFGKETTEAEEDEVLNYSDSDLKSDHPHLPARSTGIPVSPTWGYLLAFNESSSNSDGLESRNSLSSDSENLQSADSQSFVSQFNKVTQEFKTTLSIDATKGTTESSLARGSTNEDTAKGLPENHWTASSDVAKLWQTTLSINPAVLNENFDSSQTAQGFTSPDIETRFTAGVTSLEDNSESSSDSGETTRVSEIQYELRSLPRIELNSTQVHGILIDFMNASKTEGSGKLQRILHKLNISQDEFLNKMKEIEGNPLTRRLILLLISECNTGRDKELETRAASSDDVFGIAHAQVNADNTEQSTVTSRHSSSADDDVVAITESNSFKHIVHPSLDEDDEDTRALELLNSLYVIASKFGK